jgi:hypothetical protein
MTEQVQIMGAQPIDRLVIPAKEYEQDSSDPPFEL